MPPATIVQLTLDRLRLFRDIVFDRAAARKPKAGAKDAVTAFWAALGAAIAGADLVGGVLTRIVGDSIAAWLPLIVLVALLALGAYIVAARDAVPVPAGIAVKVDPSYCFRYAQPVRQIAKLAVLVLVVVVPMQLVKVIHETSALPSALEGVILDEGGNGSGVANAAVRVIDHDGKDLTDGRWFTDNMGNYFVRATKSIPRTATLRVVAPDCGTATFSLSLARSFETHPRTPGVPAFRHLVNCKETR